MEIDEEKLEAFEAASRALPGLACGCVVAGWLAILLVLAVAVLWNAIAG